MKILYNIEQGSEQWEALRAIRPTCSNYSKIYTATGKVSAQREAYMRQLAIATKYTLPTWTGNQYTDRGNELEPAARERFIQETQLDVRQCGFVLHEKTIAGGSPDGLIFGHNNKPISGIEIKCLNVVKHLGIVDKREPATDHLVQMHGLMWLMGLDVWVYVAYCPEAFPLDFQPIEVRRTQFTDELGKQVELFCDELIENTPRFIKEFEDKALRSLSDTLPNVYKALQKSKAAEAEQIATKTLFPESII